MYVGALDYNPEYVGKDVGGTLPKRDTSSCFSAAKERISLSFNPYQYHLMVFYLLNYRQINHTCKKKNSLKNKARLAIIPITHDFDRFRKGNKIFKTPQVFIWAVRLNMQRPHWNGAVLEQRKAVGAEGRLASRRCRANSRSISSRR